MILMSVESCIRNTVILFRQNEEESSYDTKPVKSNLQNGHHNNPEFSKEQGKGRQNGYDNNDDRLVFLLNNFPVCLRT
jgi:hypothetical protein